MQQLGRWLSRDPLGETAGLNLYAYCDNDPINNVDPDGTSPSGCLDSLYACLSSCVYNLRNDLWMMGGNWVDLPADPLAVPAGTLAAPTINKGTDLRFFGYKNVHTIGTTGTITLGSIMGRKLVDWFGDRGLPLNMKIPTPTVTVPGAYTKTFGALAGRLINVAATGLSGYNIGRAVINYNSCAKKCNAAYDDCMNKECGKR